MSTFPKFITIVRGIISWLQKQIMLITNNFKYVLRIYYVYGKVENWVLHNARPRTSFEYIIIVKKNIPFSTSKSRWSCCQKNKKVWGGGGRKVTKGPEQLEIRMSISNTVQIFTVKNSMSSLERAVQDELVHVGVHVGC